MIQEQLVARGIRDPRVLDAMASVPRERFVADELQPHAYDDRALPIDCEQSISQPYIVALMTEALELTGSERVFEVGTGSGYQAAILAELAHDVITVERHEPLFRRAAKVLAELGYTNIRLLLSDGSHGLEVGAPFDRIIVTAAADHIPAELFDQLADGGILVIPVGGPGSQVLKRMHKVDGRIESSELTACRFVPLVGNAG